MHEEPTIVVIQRYLEAMSGDTAAEAVVRELLERAVGRLRLLCVTFLHKSYSRLTRPPVNLPRRRTTPRVPRTASARPSRRPADSRAGRGSCGPQ
jgi:RNA polymerase sigma-70 factor (ECF subfamily)